MAHISTLSLEPSVDVRYVGQGFELTVSLAGLTDADAADWRSKVKSLFDQQHQLQYKYHDPAGEIEILSLAADRAAQDRGGRRCMPARPAATARAGAANPHGDVPGREGSAAGLGLQPPGSAAGTSVLAGRRSSRNTARPRSFRRAARSRSTIWKTSSSTSRLKHGDRNAPQRRLRHRCGDRRAGEECAQRHCAGDADDAGADGAFAGHPRGGGRLERLVRRVGPADRPGLVAAGAARRVERRRQGDPETEPDRADARG